jgi:hypothetical protein
VVWSGVAVSNDALAQCIGELRRKMGDEERRLIKTISRRGYRFDATVTPSDFLGPNPQSAGANATDWVLNPVDRIRHTHALAETVAEVAPRAVVGGGQSSPPDRQLSLIVLPFQNLGGDPEQEYFADGITSDLMDGCLCLVAR